MNQKPKSELGTPHLTPASLVGQRFGPDAFDGISVAIVGFCPRPDILDSYEPRETADQYFIHVPPVNVQICQHNSVAFLSIYHVYGGPVASALIEELAFYGISTVLAYGLAGGLGTLELEMGDYYIVERALAMDGTTPHYTDDMLIPADESLAAVVLRQAPDTLGSAVTPVQALTSDAIYREFDQDLDNARQQGCDIVNCDSSHLFAVSREVGIKTIQCGVISDVAKAGDEEWESTLSVMLSAEEASEQDPLGRVNQVIRYYVETLLPVLV